MLEKGQRLIKLLLFDNQNFSEKKNVNIHKDKIILWPTLKCHCSRDKISLIQIDIFHCYCQMSLHRNENIFNDVKVFKN
jgi:hypothetical protein